MLKVSTKLNKICKDYGLNGLNPTSKDHSRYKGKIDEFCYALGFKIISDQQLAICEALINKPEIPVPAGHGIGKTKIAAAIVIYWVFVEEGLCATTAPTERQVNQLLWREIRILYDANKHWLGGYRTQLQLFKSESAKAYGFTASDFNYDAFQGIHHDRLLVIGDEAGGIAPAIMDGMDACVTGANNRLLLIGNPVVAGTAFHEICKGEPIVCPVWDHPNVKDLYYLPKPTIAEPEPVHELKPEIASQILSGNKSNPIKPQSEWPDSIPRDAIPGAVSVNWIERIRVKKGTKSSYWKSRIEAQFPEDNAESIVPRSWFLAARALYDSDPDGWEAKARLSLWSYGVDPADGEDDHAIGGWHGCVFKLLNIYPTKGDRMDIGRISKIAHSQLKKQPGLMGIDRIGVGAGVVSNLKTELIKEPIRGASAWGAGFGDKSSSPDYLNWKAEQFWLLREAIQFGEVAIAPLGEYEDYLLDDLASIFYEETDRVTRIESKSKTISRLGRSPNGADCMVIGFAKIQRRRSGAGILGKAL